MMTEPVIVRQPNPAAAVEPALPGHRWRPLGGAAQPLRGGL